MSTNDLNPSPNPFEGTIAVKIVKHGWGIHRKVKKNQARVVTNDGSTVDERAVDTTKKLLECKEYKAIKSLDSKLDADLALLSVPSVLWDGVKLIPFAAFRRAQEIIEKYEKKDRPALVQVFAFGAYEGAVEESRNTLGQLFDARQYPSPREMAEKFSVDYSTVNFAVSDNLKEMDQKLWEEQSARLRENMLVATEEMKAILRAEFLKVCRALADKLTGENEDGKPKVFRDSAVTNVTEWLDTFQIRNITNDQELAGIVEKCKKLVSGIDPDDLRKDMDFRKETSQAMEKVTKKLDELLVSRPGRKFSFEEDQDAAQ
jgi:hypothetical protein